MIQAREEQNAGFRIFFSRTFPSTVEDMSGILHDALNALRQRHWIDDGERFRAHLCLEEALMNAIQHGNLNNELRKIKLEIGEDADMCRIRIWDEGKGFCPDDVPDPGQEQMRGRGLCLIKHYMDEVKYDCVEHCLEMTMQRNAKRAGGSDNGG